MTHIHISCNFPHPQDQNNEINIGMDGIIAGFSWPDEGDSLPCLVISQAFGQSVIGPAHLYIEGEDLFLKWRKLHQ